jgi:cell wall-associated NlpC family hydrolase
MVNYQSLLGRIWSYGENDCFSLIRDYYKLLGIQLPDYERPDDLTTCESIFLDQLPKKGFYEIKMNRRQPNDILIMQLGTKTPMHGAIVLPEERILHQKTDSLSCVELLSDYYIRSVRAVFRYAAEHSAA